MYFSSDAALCICLWLCPFVLAALCALSLIRSGACFLIRAPDRVQSRGKKRTQRAHCAACQPHQRFSVRRPQAPNFPLTSYTHPHSHSHSHTPSSQLPPASPLASSSASLPPSKIRPSKKLHQTFNLPKSLSRQLGNPARFSPPPIQQAPADCSSIENYLALAFGLFIVCTFTASLVFEPPVVDGELTASSVSDRVSRTWRSKTIETVHIFHHISRTVPRRLHHQCRVLSNKVSLVNNL